MERRTSIVRFFAECGVRHASSGYTTVRPKDHQLDGLVNVMASPTEQRVKLVGVDDEVNDKRDGGQHEYQVSHGCSPR